MRYVQVESDGIRVDLRNGEVMLIMRALRTYMCAEQQAIQAAWKTQSCTRRESDRLHYEDVKQHAQSRIDAAARLLGALQPQGRAQHAGSAT